MPLVKTPIFMVEKRKRTYFISLYVPWLHYTFVFRNQDPTPSSNFYHLKRANRKDRFFLGCQLITITEVM